MKLEEFSVSIEEDITSRSAVVYISHRPTGLSTKHVIGPAIIEAGLEGELFELAVRRLLDRIEQEFPLIRLRIPSVTDWTTGPFTSPAGTIIVGTAVWPGTTTTTATGPTYTPEYFTTTVSSGTGTV